MREERAHQVLTRLPGIPVLSPSFLRLLLRCRSMTTRLDERIVLGLRRSQLMNQDATTGNNEIRTQWQKDHLIYTNMPTQYVI